MSLLIVAALTIGGLAGVALVTLAIPTVAGLVAYDVFETRRHDVRTAPDAEERIWVERGFARGFVIAGGVFWTLAMVAGLLASRGTGGSYAWLGAFFPLVATLVTLVVGWYFERATTVLLVLASAVVTAWGVVAGFELGVWAIVFFALIGPMLTAAVLFWLARSQQNAFELSVALRTNAVPIAPTEGPLF